jgi:hypothetical protein
VKGVDMKPISIAVAKTVELNRDRLFDYFIPIELPEIFQGYGLLPAVVAVYGQTGDWDIPGHARTVHLSDGSTIYETITICNRPDLFSYKLSKFTGIFGFLVAEAISIWKFNRVNNELTEIVWEYSFYAKGIYTRLILKPILKLLFQRYMQQIVEIFSDLAKKNQRS